MVANIKRKTRFQRFIYFFPFQLFFLHLKRNHFLLFFWLALFAFTTQNFAMKLGIPYLFLAPEYRGEIGIWSFAILGFSLGCFIMVFNIYSYILHSKRFPFLGTLARPFFKFCINNSIIPLGFFATYIYCSSTFLMNVELQTPLEVVKNMLAFLGGNAVFIALAVLYFFPTNKNIFKITGNTAEQLEALVRKRRQGISRQVQFQDIAQERIRWRVDTYLTHPFKVLLARDSRHYDHETLKRVFYQNHINASFFEILIVIGFLIIGAFQFNSYFIIPAAASACFLFTVILMLISILMSWLKGWTLSIILVLVVMVDYASGRWQILNTSNYAYGLNYEVEPVEYNAAVIDSLNNDLIKVKNDQNIQLGILNDWLSRERKRKKDPTYKPRLVVFNASGGGLRSSLWTMHCLQYLDSVTNDNFFQNVRLLSGSSGGTIGAAYYRELYLRKDTLKPAKGNPVYLDNISKDALNSVLFSLATNDIFIRFRKRTIAGKDYLLDRGMAFEYQFNENTENLLNKRVSDYTEPVLLGKIPMMVLAPSIVNDGRRLLISSQPISYLCYEFPDDRDRLNMNSENVEFNRLFTNHEPEDLQMTSALRMNSTFPYIFPYASLPTEPRIEVMDAGLRDNFGIKISAQYILSFKKWIEEHTSGILIVQVRDTEKNIEPKPSNYTLTDKLLNPIGSFYGNLFNDQDYNMDQYVKLLDASMEVPIDHVPLEIRYGPGEHIALNWHLTELEKQLIFQSIHEPWNQESVNQIRSILSE